MRRALLPCLALTFLAACSEKPTDHTSEPPAVASVVVTGASSVTAGSSTTLTATVRDAGNNTLTGRTVTWASSNSAIASVSNGVVTGAAPGGPVTITATSEGKKGTAQITVTAIPVEPVATVILSQSSGSIVVGNTLTLTATTRDGAGHTLDGRAITWGTSNSAIATVSNGVVTGVTAGGPVTITATSEGKNASAQITITPAPVATITLSSGTLSIPVATSATLTATTRDGNGTELTGRTITWGTSNGAIATVANGVVTGVSAGGPVAITATSEGKTATAQVTVTAVVAATEGQISSGLSHSCGIVNGAARCWGSGDYGQLGGTITPSIQSRPTQVQGGHTFNYISAGFYYTCALDTAGAAWCWGMGGALGNGTFGSAVVPVAVTGGHVFTRIITTLTGTTCALTANGSAWCWGEGTLGQMGDGANISRSAPVAVSGGLSFVQLGASVNSICGRIASGTVYCWGGNVSSSFGTGSASASNVPVLALGGQQFVNLLRGVNNICAVKADGSAWCAGKDINGSMGTGSVATQTRSTPTQVSGGIPFANVTMGDAHGCGRTPAGEVYCWGNAGLLGDGTNAVRGTPGLVSGGQVFTEIDAGHNTTCGRTVSGQFYCWGNNPVGQVGDGTVIAKLIPALVLGVLV